MIVHDVKQGTPEWSRLRAGIPTSSEFARLVTPTGKASAQAEKYRADLIAERMLGRPLEKPITMAMERGSELEAEAIAAYEFYCSMDTELVGFVTDDLCRWGTSPDRLVGEDGLLEIKCPDAGTHAGYLLAKPADRKFFPQLQGQLFITCRKWVDIMSFHPEMPPAIVRVERDEAYIGLLSLILASFSASLMDAELLGISAAAIRCEGK